MESNSKKGPKGASKPRGSAGAAARAGAGRPPDRRRRRRHGLSAKCAEAGGVDLIIIYNSGRYRMAGRGSLAGLLPYGDANAIVVDMAREVLPVVKTTPVLAGVCGTDPFRMMEVFLPQLREMGFSGVQNFPTVGLFDGVFRQNLEETGMGYDLEVDMIRQARALDLLTAPYVFNAGGSAPHDRGRRRRPRPPRRPDHLRRHRRQDGNHPRRSSGPRAGHARRGERRQPRRPRPLPRRPHRHPGGRRLRPRPHARRRRLLRRLQHGAPTDRDRHHRHGAAVQGDVIGGAWRDRIAGCWIDALCCTQDLDGRPAGG